MLRPELKGSTFLDLFAGSGAMGIEALSQGASHATFVESNKAALKALHSNLEMLNLVRKATIFPIDVEAALRRLKGHFQVIYADPPYRMAEIHYRILSALDSSSLANGTVILEEGHPSKLIPDRLSLNNLCFKETRRYGMSVVHMFKRHTPLY